MKAKALMLVAACWVSACDGQSGSIEPVAVTTPSVLDDTQATLAAETPKLPANACTLDGYWSFFEAFVQSGKVRSTYTNAAARDAIEPFRIGLSDNQWVYVDDSQKLSQQRLELKEARDGDSFRVDYIQAKFDVNDEIESRDGHSGSYTYRFENDCWRLTSSE